MNKTDDCLNMLIASALPSRQVLAQIRQGIPTPPAMPIDPARKVANIFAQAFANLDRWKMPCIPPTAR